MAAGHKRGQTEGGILIEGTTTRIRWGGLVCMVGSAVGIGWAIVVVLDPSAEYISQETIQLLFSLTIFCFLGGMLGLYARRVTGSGRLKWLGLASFALAVVGTIQLAINSTGATDLAWLLLASGMTLWGIAILAAKQLPPRLRALPLIIGPWTFAVFLSLTSPDVVVVALLLALWFALWALLGYGVWSNKATALKPRQSWSDRIAQSLSVVIAWIRWLIRPLLAIVVLYVCLFLLQIVGLAPDLAHNLHPLSLQLESQGTSSDHITLVGQTTPKMLVEVGVNERILDNTRSDPDGHFGVDIQVPCQTNQIWAQTRDRETSQVVDKETIELGGQFARVCTPALDVAAYITDTGKLWVAGRAMPFAGIKLETENGATVQDLTADNVGVFDRLISLDSAPRPDCRRTYFSLRTPNHRPKSQ